MNVRMTDHFMACMASIEAFLEEVGASHAYDGLLDTLSDTVIPNLERYPQIGRVLLDRPLHSMEAQVKVQSLQYDFPAADIREYISGDYLLLYVIVDDTLYLLSIRHHRQLSYELPAFWL